MDDIDVTLILHKNVKLDTAEGDSVDCSLHVMENENPYALIFMVSADDQQCRLDISKDLIADQLKGWLEGDQVEASCIAVPTKIEEEIMKYVKFGTPPKPVLLAHWLLSRCQLKQFPALSLSLENKYQKPPKIDMSRLSKTNEKDSHKHLDETRFSMNSVKTYTTIEPPNNSFERSMEQATVYATKKSLNDDTLMSKSRNKQYDSTTSTVYLAQEMMGESQALNSLKGKTSKNSTMPVENVKYLSNDHYRLSNQLETSRRNVEKSLDKRRMMMEVSKVRAKSLVEKFTKSRDMAKFAKRGNAWTKAAELEVENIRKIQESIEDDMVRQRSRGAHAVQRVMWTLAPNGLNLGGKSLPGPIIGRGPLPSEATTAQKDPRIEKTISHFYWDEAGRKHRKSHKNNEVESLVEKAMNTIRRLGASSSTSNYKLNLKHVFEEMDKSGDGYIELPEMIEGFRSLGINLDAHSIEALFK